MPDTTLLSVLNRDPGRRDEQPTVADLIRRERRPLPSHDLGDVNYRAWAVAVCQAEVDHRERDFYRAARNVGHAFDRWTDPNCMQVGQFPHELFAGTALVWLSHLIAHDSDRHGPWARWHRWDREERIHWLQVRRNLVHGFLRTMIGYREFTCRGCGKETRNTYCEPHRTRMLERRLCFECNYWVDFEAKLARDHTTMTIIDGHVYGPGNRTSGSFRGMAGRRFDIEYIEPSVHAGKRITTFDLWSGSTMPEGLRAKYADTARFLGGAQKVSLPYADMTACWDPSDGKTDPYPLPKTLGIGIE